MSIYRGAGGAGDAVADSSSEALLIRELVVEAQADADAAAASATAAAGSASTASTQASNASTSATNAANSATAAAGYVVPTQTGNAGKFLTTDGTATSWGTASGGVTSVTGTAPVVSSGGATPAISMAAATTSVNGYLTSTDWTTFNSKQAALTSGTNIKTVGGASLLGSGDVGTIGAIYGGTAQSTYTTGDILYASASNTLSKLTVGSAGQVLTVASGVPSWAAGGGFATGTVLLFYQASAPTGWTQVTTQNNKALRVVSGTGGGTGGSVTFTTAFASQAVSGSVGTSGATTITTSTMPSHTHTFFNVSSMGGSAGVQQSNGSAQVTTTSSTGSDGSHTHTGGTFTGTAINLAVQYIDIIIASKN